MMLQAVTLRRKRARRCPGCSLPDYAWPFTGWLFNLASFVRVWLYRSFQFWRGLSCHLFRVSPFFLVDAFSASRRFLSASSLCFRMSSSTRLW